MKVLEFGNERERAKEKRRKEVEGGKERRGERKTIEKWNWRSGARTQRDQCVWLPHGEEDDDINPLFSCLKNLH